MTVQSQIVSRVEENQQAIVIVLLARNTGGATILDSQLELAMNMAKNVLQMGGAEVAASASAIRFDATQIGEIARVTATLDTVEREEEVDPTEEPTVTETQDDE